MEALKTGLAAIGGVAVGAGVIILAREAFRRTQEERLQRRIDQLEGELKSAVDRAENAESVLERAVRAPPAAASERKKPVRVYMDGCFDMMHFGHSNALRQAKALGDVLVVGLIGDAEVERNKGAPPLMPEEERFTTLIACKWVDEVIRDVPYELTDDFIKLLFDRYDIDYIVHGDDPCITADGRDAYALPKRLGRFKTIKRTEGVSTTDLVGRMLLMTREHHLKDDETARDTGASLSRFRSSSFSETIDEDVAVRFLPTSRRIVQFASGQPPKPGQRIVYICGSFDMFHSGHVDALRRARAFGDFLLVGVHSDRVVNQMCGGGYPIMNLHERALSVLACKYVDEVIIGAPLTITRDMLVSMNIAVVVHGSVHSYEHERTYAVPKDMDIFHRFESPRPLVAEDIVKRILKDREQYQARFDRKKESAEAYYKEKQYVAEL